MNPVTPTDLLLLRDVAEPVQHGPLPERAEAELGAPRRQGLDYSRHVVANEAETCHLQGDKYKNKGTRGRRRAYVRQG